MPVRWPAKVRADLQADGEVRSGGRAIKIVEMFVKEGRPVSAGEISARLGIPQTSVHRLLTTLVSMRWAERRSGRLYQIGPGLLGVGGLGLGRSSLVQLARPVLAHIAEMSELDSYLGVLVGDAVTYLERASGAEAPQRDFKLGTLQPIHCTAAGKLLFAFLPEPERNLLLQTISLRAYTERTLQDRAQLADELALIRGRGYSIDPGEFNEFWRSVAVPIHGASGEVVAAITCGGRPAKMTVEHQGWIRQEMTTLAEDLSAHLG